jgi:hypothetical protein
LPAIPDHDRAAAVPALRNSAFEGVVFNRVVLDVHREALFARVEAGPTRHRPALHDAIEFEPKIVVQPPRGMFLDHVAMAATTAFAATRFGGDAKFPFLSV